jgi:hypothetical protein
MKMILLLIPMFSFVSVSSPVHIQLKDDRFIENTNLNFETIDLSKLVVQIYQSGCFNHNEYKINFKKGENGYFMKVFRIASVDYDKPKVIDKKIIVDTFLTNKNLQEIKTIFVGDPSRHSTMHNFIGLSYNDELFTFTDNDPEPLWQTFIYKYVRKH